MLEKINPKMKECYSKNLYLYLKNKNIDQSYVKVYKDKNDKIYIGILDDEWFHGTMINQALCMGGRSQSFAHPINKDFKLKEINGFWNDYIIKGVCAIDKEHSFYPKRWELQGYDSRVCKWCGHKQVQKEVVTTTYEWKNAV